MMTYILMRSQSTLVRRYYKMVIYNEDLRIFELQLSILHSATLNIFLDYYNILIQYLKKYLPNIFSP